MRRPQVGLDANLGMSLLAIVFIVGAGLWVYGLMTLDSRDGAKPAAVSPPATASAATARSADRSLAATPGAAGACRDFARNRATFIADNARIPREKVRAATARTMADAQGALVGIARSDRALSRALPGRGFSANVLFAYARWEGLVVREVRRHGPLSIPPQHFSKIAVEKQMAGALVACTAAG